MAKNIERKYLEAHGGPPAQPSPPATEQPLQVPSFRRRGLVEAYLLLIPLGWMGAHQFYLRRPGWGVLYLFTVGLFGIGYLTDFCRLPGLVKKANKMPEDKEKSKDKSLIEAYILWFPCGLFGAHHFYLRQWGLGCWYMFTFGLLGLGWIMDGIAMPWMLKEYRVRHRLIQVENNESPVEDRTHCGLPMTQRSPITAYRLCLFPFTGLFGGHHYYLGRVQFGLFYTFTLGGFGVGWFCDWFRLSCLTKDVNKRIKEGRKCKERRLDDCYLIAIPMGLFGSHHFYLRRIGWGFLYLFTVGLFGIGWIVDLVRMHWLLKAYKEKIQAQRRQLESANIRGHVNPSCGIDDTSDDPTVPKPYPVSLYPEMPDQHSQTIAPGTYAITPAPPYTAVPGVHPPVLPQVPPSYGAIGHNSWSTIDSSDVDGPPSYEASVLQPTAPTEMNQNRVNEKKE